ncbi:hypothetical protein Cgig2_029911 [Carnegiea gigantea]|uniref:Transposase-associated domain-containing protein n=1 Tax=Carnegiea gigantea TaxID=171969 RepID=A0A9Q1QJS6_9CARY|nr:hypothetical protein Cgig2_029911 [Carnegiea gigantea]
MDSRWVELPNDHPDYLNDAVKFIKLTKENLVDGRTRCLCRRCKVDKWVPIAEVKQHILFKGFYKEYKHFIFHGQWDILDQVKDRESTSRKINNDQPNFVGRKRTLKALGTKSSGTAQPLTHPSFSTATAQPAMRLDLKRPTHPSPFMTPAEPLGQKPPDLAPATQVQ